MKLNLNNYGKKFKFKKREKKEKIISEKDLFIETLDFLEKNWAKSNQVYDLFGINLLEYEESYFKAIENLIVLKYGMWKAEIILWYVFGRKDNEDDTDIFDGSVDEIQVEMNHQDVGLILGYRWSDDLLHYVNAIYYEEEARGKVTNNTATLVDAPFKFNNSGAMYSTGLIIYAGRIHFKADFSHTTTNWTSNRENSVNILNGAIGLNW